MITEKELQAIFEDSIQLLKRKVADETIKPAELQRKRQ